MRASHWQSTLQQSRVTCMVVGTLTFELFLKESAVQKALMTSSTSAITCRRGYWLMSLCITCHCQGYKLKGKAYAWSTVCAILLTHGGCCDGTERCSCSRHGWHCQCTAALPLKVFMVCFCKHDKQQQAQPDNTLHVCESRCDGYP